jgi:glycosyltransferase involved in cell wall biosynthesis
MAHLPKTSPLPVGYTIRASSPTLELSGANVLVANLLDELSKDGRDTGWIVTGHTQREDAAWLGDRRFTILRLPTTRLSDVRRRQKLFLGQLKPASPCIYLPNFDFDMACAIPALPAECRGVLIMHCDDPVYYEFVDRHGELFDAIVCVSTFLASTLKLKHPELANRVIHIPFGIKIQNHPPERKKDGNSSEILRVAYCGRLSFHQKRIQDLASIINRCHAGKLPVEFHIAGAGSDEEEFFESINEPLAQGIVHRHGFLKNSEVLNLLEQSDVLLMTSDFEGLPVVLLEAMSRGCIPVVTRIQSGMGEVVRHEETGFLHPVGEVNSFVTTLANLARDTTLREKMALASFEEIKAGGFTLERAAADYGRLFDSLVNNKNQLSKRSGNTLIPNRYRFWHRMKERVRTIVKTASK